MIHERLDIANWKAAFQLDRLRAEEGRQPDACIITGPYDIAVLEQLRERAYGAEGEQERVPTDVFVWSRGEPEQRAVTKISGLPYREAGKPWPTAPTGVPLNFVAQINFADSRDITPALPGDLLLIFAEGKAWRYRDEVGYDFAWGDGDERDSAVAFEWVTLGDFPLVGPEEAPQTPWRIQPCYAAIHRTWDYPEADGFAYPEVAEHIPTVFEATKIGGVCPWLDQQEEMPGTYLCSLSSIDPEISKPYPYLNVPEPFSYDELRASHRLMIGDVGLLNFYMNADGDVRWVGHSH